MKKRFITVAGKTILVREIETFGKREYRKRAKRRNQSSEAVAKVNQENRKRDLTAKINHNFKPGDLWITADFMNELNEGRGMTPEECNEVFRRFRRSIQRWAKNGIEIKMIYSFGIGRIKKKPHFHIVMSDIPSSVILQYWTYGAIHIEVLWPSGQYSRIAKYMLKNAYEAKDISGRRMRSYNCTRNIVTPATYEQVMKSTVCIDTEDLKPFKGYCIDRDTINKYTHPITGNDCVEYIMTSLEQEPRIKYWSKGRRANPERIYREEWPEQLKLELEREWCNDERRHQPDLLSQ